MKRIAFLLLVTCAALASYLATSAPYIRDIQGTSHISPFNGQVVANVPGVVTLVQANSFFMQDPASRCQRRDIRGDSWFSQSSAPTVHLGDSVTVSGTVTEFRPGGALTKNLTITEITSPTIILFSTGNPLPAPIVIGTGGRIPPAQVIENDATDVETTGVSTPAADGIDFYESMEGS